MAIKINISGLQMDGGELLNGINVRGDSNVDIDIKDSRIGRNSKVLNNVKLQKGNLTYRASGVNIGENARVMNGKEIKAGETVEVTQKGSNYTQTTQRAQPKQSATKTTQKKGFWKKLARTLGPKVSQSETTETKTMSSSGDAHTKFANQISGDGEYRKTEYSQAQTTPYKQNMAKETLKTPKSNGR